MKTYQIVNNYDNEVTLGVISLNDNVSDEFLHDKIICPAYTENRDGTNKKIYVYGLISENNHRVLSESEIKIEKTLLELNKYKRLCKSLEKLNRNPSNENYKEYLESKKGIELNDNEIELIIENRLKRIGE